MSAVAAGELTNSMLALLAALGDDVGGTEVAAQIGAVGVASHQYDLLCAQPPRPASTRTVRRRRLRRR